MKYLKQFLSMGLLFVQLITPRTISFESSDSVLRYSILGYNNAAGVVAVEYFDINGAALLHEPHILAHHVDDEIPPVTHSFRLYTSRSDTRQFVMSPLVMLPMQEDEHLSYELSLDYNEPLMLFVQRVRS